MTFAASGDVRYFSKACAAAASFDPAATAPGNTV